MTRLEITPLFDLSGQVAVVTGASSGLGDRFARVLHAAGATVIAVARRADRLEALAAAHERMVPVVADVSKPEQLEHVVERAVNGHGRIDVLVNNAGLGEPAPAVDEDLDAFRYVLDVNLVGLFHLSRLAAVPMLAAGRGSIINVSSILGLVSSWPIANAAYTASKGAVVQLTRELACQWAEQGVRVNAIAPGYFPSEATAGLADNPGMMRHITRNCPMRRLGEPHELDGALLFLAGPASTYVTGQVLTVDGGWTAH
jgi:NAD(P)-dependent dehydrogenase (short-subunit alcohol dehydrogenase family)